MVTVSIDDLCPVDNGDPLGRIGEMPMDVSVDEIPWRIALDQPAKALKSPVASILGIVNVSWGGMRDDNVNPPLQPDFRSKPSNFFAHFGL